MAPVCVACRLRPCSLLLIVVFFLLVIHDVSSVWVYGRLTLLEIRETVNNLPHFAYNRHSNPPPAFLVSAPAYLRRPSCALPHKKRHRRRGKRGGVRVKLRAHLVSSRLDDCGSVLRNLSVDCGDFDLRRSLEHSYRWLQPVVAGAESPLPCRRPARIRSRGCVPGNLRPLGRAAERTVSCASARPPARAALLNVRSLTNKTFILNDLISTRNLDFLLLTETWQKPGDNSAFSELLPPGYSFHSTPRESSRGGGLAAVFKQSFSCRLLPAKRYSSFELQLLLVQFTSPVLCAVIYRPPKHNKEFITEFSDLLADLMPKHDSLLICGDFNVHVCCPSNQLAIEFQSLLSSFGLVQSVNVATHQHGHTLDLIISHGLPLSITEIGGICISDHLPIIFEFITPSPTAKSHISASRRRTITSTTAEEFAAAFMTSSFNTHHEPSLPLCPETFISSFHSACSGILDTIAPYRSISAKPKPDPWLNDATRALRRRCRQAERRWKKDRLHVSLGILRDSLNDYQKAVKEAKCQYLSTVISTSCNRPQVLFNTIQSVTNPSNNVLKNVSVTTCNEFLHYFIGKVASVRQTIGNAAVVTDVCLSAVAPAVFNVFEPVSLSLLLEVVQGIRPTSCPLDIIPSHMLKQVSSTLGPSLLTFINSCLSSGSVPKVFKHAVVRPRLKKPNLDPAVLSNFRPVSNLSFLSKLLEKVVFLQLQSFVEDNNILEKLQSGFRTRHSTESALLKVHNDILISLDAKKPVLLVLLDLTAAFDTVDHSILLARLAQHVGLQGSVLQWFRSYLTGRTFSVMIGDLSSTSAPLSSGVPQGSILGPVLFSLYLLPLGSIIRKHNVSYHLYADDLQLYLPIVSNSADAMESIHQCLSDIKLWLANNFLCLNESKTECILFGSSNPPTTTPGLGPLAPYCNNVVKNLGVKFDYNLKFDQQITAVVKASFFQLRLLAKVKPFLSHCDLETAIHAFISSRLDYCNTLYIGLNQTSLHRLQLVQNAAARLLTNTRKHDHITPVLHSLHWLPVKFRIQYKILIFVFNAVNGLAPPYISETLRFHQPGRALRSAGQHLLEVPRSRCKQWGDRSFTVAGPKSWNALPSDLRTTTDLPLFKTKLKTYLFKLAFH